jgi:hypothetical protein
MIKLINHWTPRLKSHPADVFLLQHVLAHTYGKGEGTEWALIPDSLMSKAQRCESAKRLEELRLIQRRRGLRTEWRVDLDVLFGSGRLQVVGPLQRTSALPQQTSDVCRSEPAKSAAADMHLYSSLENSSFTNTLSDPRCSKCNDSNWIEAGGMKKPCSCDEGKKLLQRLLGRAAYQKR